LLEVNIGPGVLRDYLGQYLAIFGVNTSTLIYFFYIAQFLSLLCPIELIIF